MARYETLILAHTNADAMALNGAVRAALKDRGDLTGEYLFVTAHGARSFAQGDRVLFLENRRLPSETGANDRIAIKNGMLGTVVAVGKNTLSLTLDGGGMAFFDAATYAHIDHG